MTVIAHHLIWTNYGTWLPSDPRGSGSQMVYTPALGELTEPHFGQRKVQPSRQVVRDFYSEAMPRLQFPVIRFDESQIHEIALTFADIIKQHQYTCYACAIMPDHVHLLIRKHSHKGETMIEHFQDDSRLRFSSLNSVPAGHPVWTKGGWNRFLDSPSAVRRRIQYVENNPLHEGLPRQHWPFVVPYDNWPFYRTPKRS
jgi:REP element-mobilizing transposase RayT